MLALLGTLAAAAAMILAFPPFGWPLFAVVSLALLIVSLSAASTARRAALLGALFAIVFVAGLMIWLRNLPAELADTAWALLTLLHVPFVAAFGWLIHRVRTERSLVRSVVVVGAWAAIFASVRWLPVFALEWADPGYTVAPLSAARGLAGLIGATGWTVVLAIASVGLAIAMTERALRPAVIGLGVLGVALVGGAVAGFGADGPEYSVAIVQGNSPCARTTCANERELITAGHLELTAGLVPGEQDLVVWAESSTGYSTDPRTNPEVAELIGAQARRLDAWLLQGTDRPVPPDGFINANVLFDPEGRMVAEYWKQHPVPFGETIPMRAIFGGLPGMRESDMVQGEGPVLFDLDGVRVASVISFEGAFGRYAREQAALGAQLLVVATNESSYGRGAAADQLIGMTRMRSAELGLDVVHAAITGASTIINDGVPGEITGLYQQAVLIGPVRLRDADPTPYARFGDWFSALVMLVGGAVLVLVEVRRVEPAPTAS